MQAHPPPRLVEWPSPARSEAPMSGSNLARANPLGVAHTEGGHWGEHARAACARRSPMPPLCVHARSRLISWMRSSGTAEESGEDIRGWVWPREDMDVPTFETGDWTMHPPPTCGRKQTAVHLRAYRYMRLKGSSGAVRSRVKPSTAGRVGVGERDPGNDTS